MTNRYDLVVIGGGTAALVASLGVAGIGGRAAVIERDRVGGDCLWTGCVPSKALIAASHAAHGMRDADRYGLESVEPAVHMDKVMETVRVAQAVIAPHDSPERLEAAGVDVFQGHGEFTGPGSIGVNDEELTYRSALIATGSRPFVPPIEGLDQCRPLTTDTLWDLTDLPERLVILGGGPIGCELGQALSRLGSTVTIVEALDTLVNREDNSVGSHLASVFANEGINVRLGERAKTVVPDGDKWQLQLTGPASEASICFDKILVATGRRANTADLGLEHVGVGLDDRGHVKVNDFMATTGDRIFAAGDVTGKMPFTHVAAHQARLVVTNSMFRSRRSPDYEKIPYVTFTDPEIARVGLDASEAERRWGSKAVVQRYDHSSLDRAITQGKTDGWVELVGDSRRRLVGATIVGPVAGESISELTAWIAKGEKIDAVSNAVHAYPTFSEGPSRAADDLLRDRFFNPKMTRFTRPALNLLRRFDVPG